LGARPTSFEQQAYDGYQGILVERQWEYGDGPLNQESPTLTCSISISCKIAPVLAAGRVINGTL